jgi:hypothetical protein
VRSTFSPLDQHLLLPSSGGGSECGRRGFIHLFCRRGGRCTRSSKWVCVSTPSSVLAPHPTSLLLSLHAGGEYSTLLVSTVEGVTTVTLNRPTKRNAINFAMYEEVVQALEAAASDSSVSVVVLTGTGDFYSSGNDLNNFMTPELGEPGGPERMAKKVCIRCAAVCRIAGVC